MTEGLGERPIRGIKEQKERLSDEELGNLLAAIGNHEAKAVTLLVMRPGEIYTRGELFKELSRAQGKDKGWKIHSDTLFSYCEDSLAPIGLVAKEALNPDLSTYGYSKTEYGKEIGDLLAGLLLDFSLRHPDISLIDIFGQTMSRAKESTISSTLQFKKRAPIARLNIFRALLQVQHLPITETGLLKMFPGLNIFTNVRGKHLLSYLRPLSEKGILSFRTIDKNPRSLYRLAALVPEEDPPPYYNSQGYPHIRLTRLVWRTVRNNPEKLWSREEIAQHLTEEHTDLARNQRKGLASNISVILVHLHKEGYLGNLSLPQSEISINDTQRGILSDLLTLLDKVQNRDKEVLETGKKLADRLKVNPGIIAELLRKAREHSAHARQQSTSETVKNIKTILSKYPNSTAKEITKYLNEDLGRNLRIDSIHQILSKHLRGELVYETDRGRRRFSLAPKAEKSAQN